MRLEPPFARVELFIWGPWLMRSRWAAPSRHLPAKKDAYGAWGASRINLQLRTERTEFRCVADAYDYSATPPGSIVVDFANQHVGGGGGLSRKGFVQEEQMVAQTADFAFLLSRSR